MTPVAFRWRRTRKSLRNGGLVRIAAGAALAFAVMRCDSDPGHDQADVADDTPSDTSADADLQDASTDAPDGAAPVDASSDGDTTAVSNDGILSLTVVSGRPDMVTGDGALVRILATDGVLDDITLWVNQEATAFPQHPDPRGLLVRLEGLVPGDHVLEVRRDTSVATLPIVVYPVTGPVFSGPHQTPYFCTTEVNQVGAPLDDNCSVAPRVVYFYKNQAGQFAPLADPAAPPADVATAVTLHGQRVVPFVVQIEAGTINRAIYWITTLYDAETPTWQPWERPATWDGGVVYLFGGGCGTGHTQGDASLGQALNDIVGLGFAWVHASLNTLNNNCNDVLSAETVMMVKEHFVERYGEPDYVMGFGGSGGSIQQHLIADNYPGLLDGLLPLASYPDIWTVLPDIMDCRLLTAYFEAHPAHFSTESLRTAVTGFARDATCAGWNGILRDILEPDAGCLPWVPATAVYDALLRPDGVRCTLQDHNRNIFGVNPATGLARRAWANEGVQYGLAALQAGTISLEAFLHLNENVGSLDIDGRPVVRRDPGDDRAMQTAYRTGRVLDGRRLAATPVIDVRTYGDVEPGDFHDSVRTLAIRDRLTAHVGDAHNHVSFVAAPSPETAAGQAGADAILGMDTWLRALAADPDDDRAAAARRTRPSTLADRCYPTATPVPGPCDDLFPAFQTPRMVAGAPRAGDVIQCAVRPIDEAVYGVPIDAAARARLDAIFPRGVCDWSAPPLNRVPYGGPWQRF